MRLPRKKKKLIRNANVYYDMALNSIVAKRKSFCRVMSHKDFMKFIKDGNISTENMRKFMYRRLVYDFMFPIKTTIK